MNDQTRTIMRCYRMLVAVAALCALGLAAQAQAKPAIINLKTVFDGYWKTKQADVQLKDRATDFDKARKGMVEDYQKANEEYRKLIDSANDQAVSAEERDKRKKSAESKLLEIKEIEQSVTSFDKQARSTLGDQQKRMRENILKEIRERIDSKAKTAGYTLVIDAAAESVNQTPVVLFNSGTPDMTEEVLSQLNATAPAGATTGTDKDKPEDKDKK